MPSKQKNTCVVLGVTGGIAAYKACELLRLLQKQGIDVYVVMTKNACQFVAPLTFETLSGHPYFQVFQKRLCNLRNRKHPGKKLAGSARTEKICDRGSG